MGLRVPPQNPQRRPRSNNPHSSLRHNNQATTARRTAAAQNLAGTVWKWTGSLFNDDTRTTPADPNNYLLEFLPQGAVAIKADCNRVGGTYTTNGNQLTITPGPSTMAACPPDSLGNEYVKQLSNITLVLRQGWQLDP